MKTEKEITNLVHSIDRFTNPFPGMTYTEGFVDALEWALELISDEEVEIDRLTADDD